MNLDDRSGPLGLGQRVDFLPISYGRRQGHSSFHPLLDTLRTVRCIVVAAYAVRPWCMRR